MTIFKKAMALSALLLAAVLPVTAQIQAGAAINITISGVPDTEKSTVNNTYPVSQSGMINMPHLGPVRAGGLMPEALAAQLESRYKSAQIYRNPTIQVLSSSTQEITNQVVHVGGYVVQPGQVKFTSGLTIFQAIQQARGPTPYGSMHRVKLFRNGKSHTYNLTQEQFWSVKLRPNDTIEVPQKNLLGR